jgi:hypothetical protein
LSSKFRTCGPAGLMCFFQEKILGLFFTLTKSWEKKWNFFAFSNVILTHLSNFFWKFSQKISIGWLSHN